MPRDARTNLLYIDMGGWNYAWRATKEAYPADIRSGLGIKEARDTGDDMIKGANSPKPPRVYLNTASGRSYGRFCNPTKVDEVTKKGTLNSKKIYGQEINSVTVRY